MQMAADGEQLLQLFDSYWFEPRISISNSELTISTLTKNANSVLQVHEEPENAKLTPTSTLIVRSFSEQLLSTKINLSSPYSPVFHVHGSKTSLSEKSNSPKSVLVGKLQTILSGKEIREFSDQPAAPIKEADRRRRRRRREKKGNSKSLSELEFEELKGFMDLGFVFSDEDKECSSLVSIIPGLKSASGDDDDDKSAISRPYLSEAWQNLNYRKREAKKDPDLLMNWRIPAFGNEMELKGHLRSWAHTVASTVR